jgi:hypothetical protein
MEQLTKNSLQRFRGGTSKYYFNPLFKNAVNYTDAIQFLGKNGMGWLVDAISSHMTHSLKKRANAKILWRLHRRWDDRIELVAYCYWSNTELVKQTFDSVDFPFDLWGNDFPIIAGQAEEEVTGIWILSLPLED